MDTNEKQRREIVKAFRAREKTLQEYGVPGMKWGQRRLPTRVDRAKASFGPGSKWFVSRKVDMASDKSAGLQNLAAAADKKVTKAKTSLGKARLQRLSTVAKRYSGKLDKAIKNAEYKRGRGGERY